MRKKMFLSSLFGGAALLCCPLFSSAQTISTNDEKQVLGSFPSTPIEEKSPPLFYEITQIDSTTYSSTKQHIKREQKKYSLQSCEGHSFRVSQLYAPLLLVGLGAVGTLEEGWLKRQQIKLSHLLNGHKDWKKKRFDDWLQYAPMTMYQGLALFPRMSHAHNLRDRLLLHATATLLLASTVNLSKHTISEWRPDESANNSFPSGHTSTAFVGAELTRLEYGNWAGITAYGIATTVGVMRMYNRRHWFNDLLAGAGIGILSARAAYWLLPWQKRLLGWTDGSLKKQSLLVCPSYNFVEKRPLLGLYFSF